MPNRAEIWHRLEPTNPLIPDVQGLTQEQIERVAQGLAAEFDARTTIAQLLGALRDVQQTVRAFSRRANIDPLTGLFNKSAFDALMTLEIEQIAHRRRNVAFAYIDLNDFKFINDTYGHMGGDAALKVVGDTLKRHCRKDDIAARLAGDEFGLMLVDASHEDAEKIIGRLKTVFDGLHFEWEGEQILLSASIGFKSYTEGMSLDEFVQQTDAAMYEQKRFKPSRMENNTVRAPAVS